MRELLQSTWVVLLEILKVVRNKEHLSNCDSHLDA